MMQGRVLYAAALAVALVQIGILVSMIASRAAILRGGHEVVLQVEPIDPRDLLRGDYVVLGYNISLLQPELFEKPPFGDRSGERDVYVRLASGDDGIHVPVRARLDAPSEAELQPDEIDIRGIVPRTPQPGSPIRVEYGIERFYVPEGEGREIEARILQRDFTIKIAISATGTAQIKSFYDGDRLLYAEPWY